MSRENYYRTSFGSPKMKRSLSPPPPHHANPKRHRTCKLLVETSTAVAPPSRSALKYLDTHAPTWNLLNYVTKPLQRKCGYRYFRDFVDVYDAEYLPGLNKQESKFISIVPIWSNIPAVWHRFPSRRVFRKLRKLIGREPNCYMDVDPIAETYLPHYIRG